MFAIKSDEFSIMHLGIKFLNFPRGNKILLVFAGSAFVSVPAVGLMTCTERENGKATQGSLFPTWA